ncbi:hypothetical protein D3C77_204140 [compost metagenome]|jgi:hypothetical protein
MENDNGKRSINRLKCAAQSLENAAQLQPIPEQVDRFHPLLSHLVIGIGDY